MPDSFLLSLSGNKLPKEKSALILPVTNNSRIEASAGSSIDPPYEYNDDLQSEIERRRSSKTKKEHETLGSVIIGGPKG